MEPTAYRMFTPCPEVAAGVEEQDVTANAVTLRVAAVRKTPLHIAAAMDADSRDVFGRTVKR